MPSVLLTQATDAFVDQSSPGKTTSWLEGNLVISNAAASAKRPLIFFNRPFVPGVTVFSAKLRLFQKEAWSGSVQLSAQRIGVEWSTTRANYDAQPTVVGSVATLTQSGTLADGMWEIDVTTLMQEVANGGVWYGFRIITNRTTDGSFHRANDSISALRPQLLIDYGLAPDQPTDLKPGGGRATSLALPTLTFTYKDPVGNDPVSSVQVQMSKTVDGSGNPNGTVYDSGAVASSTPQLDLSNTLSTWTRVITGTVTEPTPGTFRKLTGAVAWDSAVRSVEGYVSHAYFAGTTEIASGALNYMIGLNSDPATDASYASLDYAWYQAGATWEIWESGAGIVTGIPAVVGDVVEIIYDGVNVRYYLNGVIKRTVARAIGAALYLDSSFGNVIASGIKDVKFSNVAASGPGDVWYWRVRVTDGSGLTSIWSVTTSFTRVAKGTLTITAPPVAGIKSGTPIVSWTFTVQTQRAYEVVLYNLGGTSPGGGKEPLWSSGKITSTATSVGIPLGAIKLDSLNFQINVRIYDTIAREATPGDPAYKEATWTGPVVYDPITPANTLAGVSDSILPIFHLTWQRASAPDRWQIQRSEDAGATWYYIADAPAASYFVSGTSYKYDDSTAGSYKQYQWRVLAVVAGVQASGSPVVSGVVKRVAPILMYTDMSQPIQFLNPVRDRHNLDVQELHLPLAGPPVLVTQRLGLKGGHMSGVLADENTISQTAKSMYARFKGMRANSGIPLLLYEGDESYVVVAYNMDDDMIIDTQGIYYFVEFDWVQIA